MTGTGATSSADAAFGRSSFDLRALLVWGPVVLVVGFIGAALVPAVADRLPNTAESRATVGLTQDSEWPFHDAWIAELNGTLDDGSIVSDARNELGLGDDEGRITTTADIQGSRSTLGIIATAPSGEQAAGLANLVAEAMIDASPIEAPVTFLDAAEPQTPPSSRSAVLVGQLLGLLAGLLMVPFLDRNLGRLRSGAHLEFDGRVGQWIEPGKRDELLPSPDIATEVLAGIRQTIGPIAVISAGADEDSTTLAKLLTTETDETIIDGGSVDRAEATRAIAEAHSVVLIARRGRIGRRRLSGILLRLAELGAELPTVILVDRKASLSR